MNFYEALNLIQDTSKKISREEWPYFLYFTRCNNESLVLSDGNYELTGYVISVYDFDYKWEIYDRK